MYPLLADVAEKAAHASFFGSDAVKAGVLVCALLAVGAILKGLRDLRKNVSAEVRMQLAEDERKEKSTATPQPLIVKGHDDFVTKTDLQALSRKMDEELGRERGSRKKIHEEISHLQSTTAALKTETAQQTATLAQLKSDNNKLNERIDSVPARVIELLKNTKALHG